MRRTCLIPASAFTLAAVLLAAGCENEKKASKAGSVVTPTGPGAAVEQQFENVVSSVLPSVVQIVTENGEGSGVVYDDKGNIVTNDHVVAGASRIQVTPASGGKPLQAKVAGEFAKGDLAVIQVSGGGTGEGGRVNSSLKAARFGDSAKLQVGQLVLAMGNPLGLSGSVSNGIVSALGRTVSSRRDGDFPGATIPGAIQTTAAINPGNSGGALVSLAGEVTGIPSMAARDPEMGGSAPGIGFAIPSNTVTSIADQIIKNGKVTSSGRASLGVVVGNVLDAEGEPSGCGVVRVVKDGPSAEAGIVRGDIITAVNDNPTSTTTALAEVLADLKPGDSARVKLRRADGSDATVTVELGQLPAN